MLTTISFARITLRTNSNKWTYNKHGYLKDQYFL